VFIRPGRARSGARLAVRKTLLAAIWLAAGAGLLTGAGRSPAATFPEKRHVSAFDYQQAQGQVHVAFRAATNLPAARAEIRVKKYKKDYLVRALFRNLPSPGRFGPAYLTYVVWAVTPDGRVGNIGEVEISGNRGSMEVLAGMRKFGIAVTAEPYFAVPQPSDRVVLESDSARDSRGALEPIPVTYSVIDKDRSIAFDSDQPSAGDPQASLALLEARNAVRIARKAGADRYAASTFTQAVQLLAGAETLEAQHAARDRVANAARQVVIMAEDARAIAVHQHRQP
jgi:hypothetical protein